MIKILLSALPGSNVILFRVRLVGNCVICDTNGKKWTKEESDWNFEHELKLLEAGEQYSCGDIKTAKDQTSYY